jgi:hypothetical protein
MLIFRWIVGVLFAAALVCLAMYIGTGQRRFQVLALRIVKWTVVAGLGFFAVLVLERLALLI